MACEYKLPCQFFAATKRLLKLQIRYRHAHGLVRRGISPLYRAQTLNKINLILAHGTNGDSCHTAGIGEIQQRLEIFRRATAVRAVTGLMSALLVFSPFATAFAEDGLTIKFKASKSPEIREVQEALVQTWGYVSTQFLDTSFNGADWPQELQTGLNESFEASSPEDVYGVIQHMLGKLGDPFTRVIPPKTAGAFENATEGQIVSIGFQVGEDHQGLVRLVFVAEDSPAQRAGLQVGDQLVSINGRDARRTNKQELAALLKNEADVVLLRNLASLSSEAEETFDQRIMLHLTAEPIEVHPVQYAVLPGDADGRKTGYIRLVVFSKNAPDDVAEALRSLKADGVGSIVLDLRDNVGGVVLSGYQIAQLFLPEGARFCYVEDGRGAYEDVKMMESHQLTDTPMMVLVNGGTASTAELIAASLRENERATLVGEQTFGKGRTQRVIKLKGGGLLLLSNTLYLTPMHQKVDKVGLTPDIACKPDFTESSFWSSGDQTGSENLLKDPCISLAVDRLNATV